MRIGELAEATGTSSKTIRYYESIGLLPEPDRLGNGYRDYPPERIALLRFVRDSQAAGLSLTEIGAIVALRKDGEATCAHVIGLLDSHLEQLDDHIASLQTTRSLLAGMVERARGLDPADCVDASRCQTISAEPEEGVEASAVLHGAPRRHHH